MVDSLGAAVRRELLEEFVRVQLQPYDALFGPDKAHANLDQVRYKMCNSVLYCNI